LKSCYNAGQQFINFTNRKTMENSQDITLTPEAAIAIKTLIKEQNLTGHSLRIFIAGVG
jgi:hypothetical protein